MLYIDAVDIFTQVAIPVSNLVYQDNVFLRISIKIVALLIMK